MENIEQLVAEQARLELESGIKPLCLNFIPICDLDEGIPFAYRTKTVINSTVEGVLEEKDYTFVSDEKDIGVELFKHNLKHALNAINVFKLNRKNIEFLTVRCPANVLKVSDVYTILKEFKDRHPDFDARKICIEFPMDIMDSDTEKTAIAFKDIKLLKFRTAINGVGSQDFKMAKLAYITPDIAFLDKDATNWADDRNKPLLLSKMISYLTSTGVQVICQAEKKFYRSLQRTDSIGFIQEPNEIYSLEQAIQLGKEDDDDA